MARLEAALLLFSGVLAPCASGQTRFDQLAPDASVTWSLEQVPAEFGVLFFMNPTFVAGRIPRGLAARTLSQLAAAGDTAAQRALRSHPADSAFVLAVAALGRVDSFAVAAGRPHRVIVMQWTVPVRVIDSSLSLDRRSFSKANGDVEIVLGIWSSDAGLVAKLSRTMSMVSSAVGAITIERDQVYRGRIRFANGGIDAECVAAGPPTAMGGPQPYTGPQFAPGAELPTPFIVYTSYGTHAQSCKRAMWRSTGSALLVRALRSGHVAGHAVQSRWHARAAAYPVP